jgi:hypothetical protein
MHKLDSDISEIPIKLPGSAFWNVFKRFGRDELIALFISTIGTVIFGYFFMSKIVLSLVGPVVEKIGFFPGHIAEAKQLYKTTDPVKRKSKLYYFKKAVKGGSMSLLEDLLVHDPIYIILMYLGLTFYPQTPLWILAALSFIIAVVLVSGGEVLYTEIRYIAFKRNLKKMGCRIEDYYEARFLISTKTTPGDISTKIAKQFNLNRMRSVSYSDQYIENNLPSFSGRKPLMRIRAVSGKNQKKRKSIQIVFVKPNEASMGSLDQYRYFPIKKDKVYYEIRSPINELRELGNNKFGRFAKKYSVKLDKKITFSRDIMKGGELLISIDKLQDKEYFIVELKVFSDVNLLIKAMKYIMNEFSVIQTTMPKSEISLKST